MDGGCKIDINGTEYFYPCDYHDSIIQVDSWIINTGSSQITLYASYPEYGVNSSGYPRIVLPSNQKGYLRSSQNATYQTVTVNSMKFLDTRFSNGFLLNIVIVGCLVCLLFKR